MPTNKTLHQNDTDRNSSSLATLTTRFEEAPVTAMLWRGRWCWRGAEVGKAIGYEHGRILVDKVRGDWAEEFREGKDYDVLRGDDLRAFKALSSDSLESGKDRTPAVLVLYESGIDTALLLSRTEKGRRLRALLADHVLPQLRATGSVTLPGAAQVVTAEMVGQMIAVAFASLSPDNSNHPLEASVLGRDADALVLAPLRRMARVLATLPGAKPREFAIQRAVMEDTIRRSVHWRGPWAMFPRARAGEVAALVRHEEARFDRTVQAAARARQLPLRRVV